MSNPNPIIDEGMTNEQLVQLEIENRDEISREEREYSYLYPSLDDPQFAYKISSRKEFYDTGMKNLIHLRQLKRYQINM